jgi:RNA polymerase sigma-70 factor, ECF subfamily
VAVNADPPSDYRTRFEKDAVPYMRQMYPAALRLTGDRCDAEDLIQETFARAYQKFDQFTPGTNLRAWLYCIMSRTFLGICRTRSRRPAEVLGADLHETGGNHAGSVPASRSAETQALDGVSDSAIMRALGELPLQFKTVIYLADIEGYQYSDIADMMGTPLGTVMSRIHRGREMLRAKLRPSQGRTSCGPSAPSASAVAAGGVSAATGSGAVPIAA